jgi:uncharacterized protein (DUF433 family)
MHARREFVARSARTRYHAVMMIEIVPGIMADPESAFGKPVIAGTQITAAQVLGWMAAGLSEAEIRTEYGLTTEQVRAALRYAKVIAEQNLDATFAALWADDDRNRREAESDRRSDIEIDGGAGFRGTIDDLIAVVDG